MTYTRRELGKLALASVPALNLLPRLTATAAAAILQKPDSTVSGVRIGLNVPYSFGNNLLSADETLQNCVKLGISALELRSQPVEGFMGIPADVFAQSTARAKTPDAETSRKAALEQLRKWRVSQSMDKVKAFRKKYEDSGVKIEIVKFDNVYTRADDELDYCFEMAKTLGARAISCEISTPLEDTKRVGAFADRHRLMVGYHGHMETHDPEWQKAFGFAKHNGANLDIGHYIAGGYGSPIPFMKAHHDRITHIHVKDRKANKGANVPFGQGDTPIKEVLQAIRDNKWNMQATIEFEYPVPDGSDRMTEIAKCIQYCKDALR